MNPVFIMAVMKRFTAFLTASASDELLLPCPKDLTDYAISSEGRVIHIVKQAEVDQRFDGRYWSVKLKFNLPPIRVHTLVATAFHGTRPHRQVVSHIDENCHNNKAVNLVYESQSANMKRPKCSTHNSEMHTGKRGSQKLIGSKQSPEMIKNVKAGVENSLVMKMRRNATKRKKVEKKRNRQFIPNLKFVFSHPEYGVVITTRNDLCKMYSLSPGNITTVCQGNMRQTKGWTCRACIL